MTEIQKILFDRQDKRYADFQAKLVPTLSPDIFIGVRVPELRKIAKELFKCDDCKAFINSLPHQYYDENLLHSILLNHIKNYDECISEIEKFLPYIDNWAVCDTLTPKVLARNRVDLLKRIKVWAKSKDTYTCRVGLSLLMHHFLDEDFKPEYLEIAANVKSDEYYVNMMVAWLLATALAKQWDSTIPLLTENKLSDWVHNKTIQKGVESFRITPEQKEYLKSLRISRR